MDQRRETENENLRSCLLLRSLKENDESYAEPGVSGLAGSRRDFSLEFNKIMAMDMMKETKNADSPK